MPLRRGAERRGARRRKIITEVWVLRAMSLPPVANLAGHLLCRHCAIIGVLECIQLSRNEGRTPGFHRQLIFTHCVIV